MTHDEYLHWKNTRGADAAKWSIEACHSADALIQREALSRAQEWIKENVCDPGQALFHSFLSIHYGSMEVDAFLQEIKAYPDWM